MKRHRDESKLVPISRLIRNNQHVTTIDGPGEKGPIDEEPSWFEWAKALSIHNSVKKFKQDRFAESDAAHVGRRRVPNSVRHALS
jgi:hypothetical protein